MQAWENPQPENNSACQDTSLVRRNSQRFKKVNRINGWKWVIIIGMFWCGVELVKLCQSQHVYFSSKHYCCSGKLFFISIKKHKCVQVLSSLILIFLWKRRRQQKSGVMVWKWLCWFTWLEKLYEQKQKVKTLIIWNFTHRKSIRTSKHYIKTKTLHQQTNIASIPKHFINIWKIH